MAARGCALTERELLDSEADADDADDADGCHEEAYFERLREIG